MRFTTIIFSLIALNSINGWAAPLTRLNQIENPVERRAALLENMIGEADVTLVKRRGSRSRGSSSSSSSSSSGAGLCVPLP
ncbi:uncharacterized protein FA14DRAFT_182604 [Meira miltonrushii]|uniref:Uncharacterized protein n=1 Tax=Meira miltonrushii TaxID=1280837 RepID=A0A316V8K5_9BASI|nr:uncharacterized protein FA14DRAFT_182604 [Meira miltonrushii]PWN31815.1 hypothetical protein FA14DRAFT_182604 [Meira miltonrushii]